jgi:hypothetical protein
VGGFDVTHRPGTYGSYDELLQRVAIIERRGA